MIEILRFPDLRKSYGLARGTAYEGIYRGTFPRPVKISTRSVGFLKHEVETVLQARIAGKTDDQIRALVAKIHESRKNTSAQVV